MLVRIEVTDTNDNHPVFRKHKYMVAIQPDKSVGSGVTQVSAFDKDSGKNSMLHFKIESGSEGFFRIDSRSVLTASMPLYYSCYT